MKYIFLIIAVLLQLIFAFYVYHKQDKDQAAMKVPMLCFCGVYVFVQFYVFFKYLIRLPESMQKYSYLIQGAILVVFIIAELLLFSSNRYIKRIDAEKKERLSDFKKIRQLFDIEFSQMEPEMHTDALKEVSELIRYANPVSHGETSEEDRKLEELTSGLSDLSVPELDSRCAQIKKVLNIRKIKQEGADK
ncbi:MAG: hypothetical protein K5668_04205 [Lachnospiraceae bacterium]|nr:hypothetical protein [Lachnospiraceae bacterium]